MPLVAEIRVAPGISESALVGAAASAERNSEHPMGRAIVSFAQQRDIPVAHPEHFEYRIGRGVLALVNGEQAVVGNRMLFKELGIAGLGR